MSVPSVPDLPRRGAQAPAWVSAVDAVMGEGWAYLELGRGSAVRTPPDEARRTGSRRRAAIGGTLSPNPQALVKLIGSGGTAKSGALRAQMEYLSRQGDVPLVSSESSRASSQPMVPVGNRPSPIARGPPNCRSVVLLSNPAASALRPVASYHLQVKTVKRSAGRSATAAAAYRAGGVIACDCEGRVHDYSRKQGVAGSFIVAPEGVPEWVQVRAALWNAAEAAEVRCNAVVAREWELALPAELDDGGRREIATAFARTLRHARR